MADAGIGETIAADSAKTAGEAAAGDALGATAAADLGGTALGATAADTGATALGGDLLTTGAGAGFAAPAAAGGYGAGLYGGAAAVPSIATDFAGGLDAAAAGITGADAASAFSSLPGSATGGIPGVAGTAPPESGTGIPGGGTGFLPVTAEPGNLSPELAQQLGVQTSAAPAGTSPGAIGSAGINASAPPTDFSAFTGAEPTDIPNPVPDATYTSPAPGLGDQITGGLSKAAGNAGDWITNHPVQAGLLGISGLQSLSKPKLPGAANTALSAAGPAVQQAQATIASGGTNTPIWQTQKTSIDTQINQELNQAIEQFKQTAASNGMGGADSAVVQQKINQLTQQAETQRQTLYAQAQQQNVTNAVNELTGGNATLGAIAQMELGQSEDAQASAAETAKLALLLGGNTPPPAGAVAGS